MSRTYKHIQKAKWKNEYENNMRSTAEANQTFNIFRTIFPIYYMYCKRYNRDKYYCEQSKRKYIRKYLNNELYGGRD
jgi:hypothetical protein